MGRSRYRVVTEGAHPYFVTSSIVQGLPLFGKPEIAGVVIDSLRFLHESGRMKLHAYVLMENHLHLIVSSQDLPAEMRKFKSFTARESIKRLKESGEHWALKILQASRSDLRKVQDYQFWEEGYHPQVLEGEAMGLQKLEYIHNNPVKRGYVDDPAYWCYSSYRNYAEVDGVTPVLPVDALF